MPEDLRPGYSVRPCPAHEAVGLGRHLPRGGVPNFASLRISPKSNGWCAR